MVAGLKKQRSPRSSATVGSPVHENAQRSFVRANDPAAPNFGLPQTLGNQAMQRLLHSRAIQAKLAVSHPGDPYEQEADRVAERVLRIPELTPSGGVTAPASDERPRIQRMCTGCEEEEEEGTIRAKSVPGQAPNGTSSVSSQVSAQPGGGQPLPGSVRAFLEPRFGYDFSGVRIHTDAKAAESARAVSALAYTLGQDIVFASGQYAPHTTSGQRLLAHELTHVVQGYDGVIRRTPDAATLATFDARADAIRAHSAYLALVPEHRAIADDIMSVARTRDNALYYIDRLELLFDTPDAPRSAVSAETSREISEAAATEAARLLTSGGRSVAGIEEATSADPSRRWTRRRGEDGTFYDVDRTDPTNIVIRARVRLQRRGTGTAADVANMRSLEDAIEKLASISGYTVDLQFVDRGGADVFTVGVDPSQWPDSGNWVGGPEVMAHELHHLLGLDDRYDYIEAHAANAEMVIGGRLHWFRVQMDRAPDPAGRPSMMGDGPVLLDDDVCRVAGLDLATCTGARSAGPDESAQIETARSQAFGRSFRAFEVLSGIRPAGPESRFDRPDEPSTSELAQLRAQSIAQMVFGEEIAFDQLTDVVGSMRHRLTPNLWIERALPGDPECTGQPTYTIGMREPVRLCPQFFTDSPVQRRRAMVREAAHLVRISDGRGETLCGAYDCTTACGGFNNADAWSHFIHCLNR